MPGQHESGPLDIRSGSREREGFNRLLILKDFGFGGELQGNIHGSRGLIK
jgi:hypothetical protein